MRFSSPIYARGAASHWGRGERRRRADRQERRAPLLFSSRAPTHKISSPICSRGLWGSGGARPATRRAKLSSSHTRSVSTQALEATRGGPRSANRVGESSERWRRRRSDADGGRSWILDGCQASSHAPLLGVPTRRLPCPTSSRAGSCDH